MNRLLPIGLALLVLGGVFALVRNGRTSNQPDEVSRSAAATDEIVHFEPADGLLEGGDVLGQVERTSRFQEPVSRSAHDVTKYEFNAPSALVHGRVIDLKGAPQSGAAIAMRGSSATPIAWTGPDGGFQVTVPIGSCLVAVGDTFVTLLVHYVKGGGEGTAFIVVAPAVDVSGTVVDAAFTPLNETRIWLQFDASVLARAPAGLDAASIDMRAAISGADGHFSIAQVPTAPGITLQVRHATHGATEIPVPTQSVEDLVIQLDETKLAVHSIGGIVVYADGSPAPGSSVRLGENNETRAGADGRFRLLVHEDYEDAPLIAFHAGVQPAVIADFGESLRDRSRSSEEIRLVLGPEALSIEGTVQHVDGEPAAGWVVALASGLEATRHRIPPTYVEELVASAAEGVTTDAAGRFHVGGLRDETYVLRIWDPTSLVLLTSDPVRAGADDVSIRVPDDSLSPMLRGRVVARDGTPLSGVQLTVKVGLRCTGGLWTLTRESVLTGALGEFVFERVPRQHSFLMCEGEAICSLAWTIPADADPLALVASVARKIPFRVVIRSDEARTADALGVLDETGQHCSVTLPGGYGGGVVMLQSIGEQALVTAEDARHAVLYKDGAEIKRVPIVLDAREIVTVEL